MIYTAIDTFYLTDEQLKNSPSRKDGIDESTETTLRIYGCDLIQESGVLLRLPQAVMATGQVLFHRFYCKKSFARFNVKRVAASCVWLASKLEESPRKAKHVLMVFHRMECRRENLPIENVDPFSKKYSELKMDLNRTERHLLKEMGFICHVEHPHKFISNYLATLETPTELRQEAWNLANDSLRTTLCVRFKSEVVACGVVYAAARRFQIPLPESPPWWKAFDADKTGIDEVCRVLAHLYSLPKAQYVHVCKDGDSFTSMNKAWDSQTQASRENLLNGAIDDTNTPKVAANQDAGGSKDVLIKLALDKLKESKKGDEDVKPMPNEGDGKEETAVKPKPDHRIDANGERHKERERERSKLRDRDRGRDTDREKEREKEQERERDKMKERSHRAKDKGKDSGHSEKSRHHSSRDRSEYHSSYSSSREKEKERHRHHPYA
ncbi:cyclin-L1-1-like protein [Cinnamomum micranthum f. kanehirae]|uniref:Cyclin-L1-1 n=1 Tax=Cinnamomum micranthum f. kanehirae TaxID=337451 RepID=A0A3S4NTQ8_9MAGN|nr:cyclin-L1-1-like protein [Cinnamomum micranthum f. kanehirae]